MVSHESDFDIVKSPRIQKLIDDLYASMPEIESDRAILVTESYKKTEGMPVITRRAKAFTHILNNIPITIRKNELIVGSATKAPRGCQTFPEFSFSWLEEEFDTIATRVADPFYISDNTKKTLSERYRYWGGKTTSELASSYMAEEAKVMIAHNVFTPNNYFYNGVGHVNVNYEKVLQIGYEGILAEVRAELDTCNVADGNYGTKGHFLHAVIESLEAVIAYAKRYSKLAAEMAAVEADDGRRQELLLIAENCERVPAKGATSFYEACQSFWFVQYLIQMESSGHSISPGRFDQYMYPFYQKDIEEGKITQEFAQELLDCIWVKLNDLNKVRDAASAEGFSGYGLFQNLIAGGQNAEGVDVTNALSYMCIEASMHVMLPQPSLSVRIWNKTPHDFLMKAAKLTRTGLGVPAYYNDEVVIPSLLNRGLTLEDARDYCIIGCVEPQKGGKTDGWHDAAFFNMCRPLELVFESGVDQGEIIGLPTKDITTMKTFEEFYDAYKTQMIYCIELLVNADNAIDQAHMERCPLPFLSSMVEDCIKRGKSVQEGGAIYNFTGPQGFGIANMADSLYVIKQLVFDEKKISLAEFREALRNNYGKGLSYSQSEAVIEAVARTLVNEGRRITEKEISEIAAMLSGYVPSVEKQKKYEDLLNIIAAIPKFGNDDAVVDAFAREVAYTYTKPLENYHNPRGGQFQAGLYPVSANVPLGAQTGATPDGRLAGEPIADGVSPTAGRDTHGPTAAANSVAKLDHGIASNGTLFNQKFHPSVLSNRTGLENFVAFIRGFFDQKGSHIQFNVVSRETLLSAQEHPENYKNLVVRVAGYSAMFTSLSRSLQDDIINRTEQQGF